VNALIGIMGSGKTSVMQGIAFALFGTFSSLGSKKISLDDLIMGKPHRKDEASVELDFSDGDVVYSVKRTIEREKGTVNAEFRKDGKLVEVSPQGVTREIERVLQMDYDLFQRAVYSEQNALDYFLQIPKGKRMQQIDEMLKLDRYEKARESAVRVRNRIFERRKEMIRVIEDMKQRKTEEKISELEKEIRRMDREKYGLEAAMEAVDKERRRLTESVVKYEANHELMIESARKSETMSTRASEMKKRIDGMKLKLKGMKISAESVKKLSSEIARLEAMLDGKESHIRMLRDGVSSKNSRIAYLRDEAKDHRIDVSRSRESELKLKKLEKLLGDDPEKRIGGMLEVLEALRNRLCSTEAEKNEMEKSLRELKGAGEKCPVCESRLTQERKTELVEHRTKHIGEFDVRIHEAKERLGKEAARVEEFRKSAQEYAELKKGLKELYTTKEKIIDIDDKVDSLTKEIRTIGIDVQKNERDAKNIKLTLDGLKLKKAKAGDLIKEKEELVTLIKERTFLSKEQRGLAKQVKVLESKIKGKDIKALRTALQEAVGKSRSTETKLKDLHETLKYKKSVCKELEEQADTLRRYKKDSESYGKLIDSMDVFVSVLRGTQDQLRDEFLKTVNHIMNDVWLSLYPYADFGEIRLVVDKDYVLQLKSAKEWMSAEVVSGGERSLASLALRIAFSLAFTPNLRWLILDEPTHNLDVNAIEHLGSVLKDRMENIVDQVFLITHEERLSDYITGTTYRLERDKESDGVTRIAEF
jgi:exonuclease SbcC